MWKMNDIDAKQMWIISVSTKVISVSKNHNYKKLVIYTNTKS